MAVCPPCENSSSDDANDTFQGFLADLGLGGLVEAFHFPSLAGIVLGQAIDYKASPTATDDSHTSKTTKSTSSTSSTSTSTSSTAPTASATPWIVQSKSGTSNFLFKSLLKGKVENYDSGTFISFPNFDLFVISLNSTTAQSLSEESMVRSVEENSVNESSDFEKASPYNGNAKREVLEARDQAMEKRAQTVTLTETPGFVATAAPQAAHLFSQVDSPVHLKMLSDPSKGTSKDKDVLDYTFQSSLGKGTYVYVLDTGVRRSHEVSLKIDAACLCIMIY